MYTYTMQYNFTSTLLKERTHIHKHNTHSQPQHYPFRDRATNETEGNEKKNNLKKVNSYIHFTVSQTHTRVHNMRISKLKKEHLQMNFYLAKIIKFFKS